MNKVILMGRLVRDPEIRQTGGEESQMIARYTLAVSRNKKTDDDSADFFSCSAFGKSAEFAEKYLRKGNDDHGAGKNQHQQLYQQRRVRR